MSLEPPYRPVAGIHPDTCLCDECYGEDEELPPARLRRPPLVRSADDLAYDVLALVKGKTQTAAISKQDDSQMGGGELRRLVNVLNHMNETFVDQWSTEQHLAFYRAFRRSEYDIPWDCWTREELLKALLGVGNGAENER